MKRIVLVCALVLLAAELFSLPFGGPARGAGYLSAELKALEAEYGTLNLSEVKVADLIPAAGRLDVARQKDGLVMMAGVLSFAWPGAGQFLTGDWGSGTLHTGLQLGVIAASAAWAHSLLPSDLRWGNLDYINAKHEAIETAWRSHAVADFLPAAGALAAGGAVSLVLRAWSSQDARSGAKAAIDEGEIEFEPRFERGHLGFGMRF